MAIVTIPVKENINKESGTIILHVTRKAPLIKREHLLSVRTLELSFNENGLLLYSDTDKNTFSVDSQPFPGEVYVVWTWVGENHRLLVVDPTDPFRFTDERFEEVRNLRQMDIDTYTDMALRGTVDKDHVYDIYPKDHDILKEKSFDVNMDTIRLTSKDNWQGSYKSIRIYSTDYLYETHSLYGLEKFMTSGALLFHADFTEPMHYQKEPVIETTFAPRDGSPVLVKDELGLLNRQFFIDYNTGEYTSDNTEEFIYKGEDVLYISYDNLNPLYETVVKFEDGETFIAKHGSENEAQRLKASETTGQILVAGDAVHFLFSDEEREEWWGQLVTVRYQLDRGYNVEYNEKSAYDSLRIQLNNHQSHPIEVIQEGNRFSNAKLGREIDLNPLVNPRHTGFLYIDKEEQHTQAFRLNLSNAYVLADGMDSADFIVEAIDEEGNEVLSPYLDVFLMDDKGRRTDELGLLTPVVHYDTMKARNMSGRCYYKYHAPLMTTDDYPVTQKVFAVAIDRRSNIGTQIPLYIRPVEAIQDEIKQTRLVSQSASLVFEYIARYFERELPAGHPLEQLDRDQDGKIDRTDFTYFESVKYNDALMQTINTKLHEEENKAIKLGVGTSDE